MSEHVGVEDALPDKSADDTDEGWGEVADRDDDERITRERPPHY